MIVAIGILLVLALISGCGSSAQVTVVTTQPVSSEQAPATSPTSEGARTGPSTRERGGEPQAGLDSFQSPSGNIFCVGSGAGGATVRCDIVEKTYATPAEAECVSSDGGGNDGRTLSLTGTEPGRFGCPSDSAISPGSPVMPYGTTKKFGAIECDMAESGIRCESQAGHGFFLSRGEAYGY